MSKLFRQVNRTIAKSCHTVESAPGPSFPRGRESTNSTLGALQSLGRHWESKNFAIVLIIRPTQVFGEGNLLLDNMAWALRRFPVFPVYGSGDYRIQPVYAGDLAAQAVAGSGWENSIEDAAGPETFTFEELLRLLAPAVDASGRLAHPRPLVGFAMTWMMGLLLRGVVLTRDEVDGLMDGLLTSEGSPTGAVRMSIGCMRTVMRSA